MVTCLRCRHNTRVRFPPKLYPLIMVMIGINGIGGLFGGGYFFPQMDADARRFLGNRRDASASICVICGWFFCWGGRQDCGSVLPGLWYNGDMADTKKLPLKRSYFTHVHQFELWKVQLEIILNQM